MSGTQVPEPLSPRSRSRAEGCDRGAGASVRQTYRTLTRCVFDNEWALRDSNPRPAGCKPTALTN